MFKDYYATLLEPWSTERSDNSARPPGGINDSWSEAEIYDTIKLNTLCTVLIAVVLIFISGQLYHSFTSVAVVTMLALSYRLFNLGPFKFIAEMYNFATDR